MAFSHGAQVSLFVRNTFVQPDSFFSCREQKQATLTVDGTSVTDSSPGVTNSLSTQSGTRMFVGGIAVNTADLSEYEDILDGDYKNGLYGCIADLMVNNQVFDLEMDAKDGANVLSCDDY